MSYDSITNRGDYLSPHYLAEVLPRDLAKKTSLRTRWAERDKAGGPTPVKGLRGLRREYFDARLSLKDSSEIGQLRGKELKVQELKEISELNGGVLRALGFTPAPQVLTVERAGEPFEVPVAYSGQNVLAVDCAWATDTDAAFDADGGDRLLAPLELSSREKLETGAKLARWLFAADEPPRYVLLLHGGVTILADRLTWAEGRYLAVSLDTALERADNAELELIAALFSADALQPPAEGGEEPLAAFVDGSRQHAVGVSAELREGLRESVQIIANEVLERLRDKGVEDPARIYDGNLAKDLGRQSLRYLYRILFLLYAEARPELGILPVDDEDYMAGYSMARLGELVARRLGGEEARGSFHLYESLAVLFRMVNNGHANPGDGEGLQFEAMKADLFDPARTKLIGRLVDPAYDIDGAESEKGGPRSYDTRLRDGALYEVLRRLMLSKGKGARRGGRRGRTERGGFISYAQLGISQLGAVYEGLMSYTGFIAAEELYEVAKPGKDGKGGDPTGGSWMIPASKVPDYADDVFVKFKDENGFQTGERVRYVPGSFVYRLAGRDRQTSASYYTPQSLTSVTVQLALEQRVKEQANAEDGTKVTANEVLRWRICEPALGSGAFLNEAIDQTAALYLKLREEEELRKDASERLELLEAEERLLALQRIKAFIALHNCYGVDLNETAVELAEVSIWLNVMHRGLQAPWFGLHLVRGNSLIGAGRRLYPAHALAKGRWLKIAPEDHPFSAGKIPSGHVHHFLLPAAGWGAVAGESEAKELAPEQARQLATWRKQLQKSPSDRRSGGHKLSQVQRLQALSARAEYLWNLVIERLRISEREISRPINVWGADNLPHAQEAIPRDQIVEDLTAPGTPYWRLKTVMDAWCSLWFWPLDKADLLDGTADVYKTTPPTITAKSAEKPESAPVDPDPNFPVVWEMDSLFGETPRQLTLADAAPKKPRPAKPTATHRSPVPLGNLDDWLDFAESLLGRQDIKEGTLGRVWNSLTELGEHEDEVQDAVHLDMDSFMRVAERFPWLKTVEEVATDQGFFHWELRFASVFREGGFDIQVGNPPWVRPIWDEGGVLAEADPWFKLSGDPDEWPSRRTALLNRGNRFILDELAWQSAAVAFFGSQSNYPDLVGTQPDLYRAFMVTVWRNQCSVGAAGMIHYDTHFVGVREGHLRSVTYRHLRLHAHFQNRRLIFPEIDWNKQFSVNIYGAAQDIDFNHISWLFDPITLSGTLAHDGSGGLPGIKFQGEWDLRPHAGRIVHVDVSVLRGWRALAEQPETPVQETKLLYPVTSAENSAIETLSETELRIGAMMPQFSRGFDEAKAKREGIIRWGTTDPRDWGEVILRGPQFSVATPFAKEPPHTLHTDKPVDLRQLAARAVPKTDYQRIADRDRFLSEQEKWNGLPCTTYYRLAWRVMIPASTERSLFPIILPPGPTHVDTVNALILRDIQETAIAAGFWSTIPLDYLLRITGRSHLRNAEAKAMPTGFRDHPLAKSLLLRTLRMNCLTEAYSALWDELFQVEWRVEDWVTSSSLSEALAIDARQWDVSVPLRTEQARRAALVELDVIVAIWLGLSLTELISMYSSRFPQLVDYESEMWFDSNGRKLAANFNQWGQGQTREHWEQFLAYQGPEESPVPDGYTAPFYKADRIAEYRQAHAAFTERMKGGGA